LQEDDLLGTWQTELQLFEPVEAMSFQSDPMPCIWIHNFDLFSPKDHQSSKEEPLGICRSHGMVRQLLDIARATSCGMEIWCLCLGYSKGIGYRVINLESGAEAKYRFFSLAGPFPFVSPLNLITMDE
jgi:hypothetical protein